MVNGFSKKAMTTVLVSSLLLSAGGAVVSAAPKEDKKDTGRTEQKVQTGVISYKDINVPRGAEKVRLSGTVVIDGPQLVVTITDPQDKEVEATVTKVGDKLWTYEATVEVSPFKGNTKFKVSADTIYANGKNAGVVHTSAPTVSQEIHVPYILFKEAKNTKWTAYERSSNLFTLTYDVIENWSNEEKVDTAETQSQIVNGEDDYVTADGTVTTLPVPFAYQDITFSPEPEAKWEFNETSKKYTVEFNVSIKDRKGDVETVLVTETGLEPGKVHTIPFSVTDEFGIFTKTADYTAPEAPVAAVPVELVNLTFTITHHNKNQINLVAHYQVSYSNGSFGKPESFAIGENFGDPNPESKSNNSSSKPCTIAGFDYTVTVTYDQATKTYGVNAVPKN